ncbi:hypothetical protein HN385_00025 [archaeon]|jgi:hypothetical protein|nr:hypothetical protein [archaeon]MBT3451198.1 hypothetical protein [archaeon]MBT6869014.1 hypothetical protein [archaeon]MBT7193602.1 hypothetical protein [archaeon]MBT7380135.1 hypothetical protein [archaeon]
MVLSKKSVGRVKVKLIKSKSKLKKSKTRSKHYNHYKKTKTKYNEFWERIEKCNAKLIPYALIALTLIIIIEIFFHIENHIVHNIILFLDYLVISIFVIDLIFIAKKCDSKKYFFKNYWLDILAVFPFMLALKFMEGLKLALTVSKDLGVGQAILHESLEIRKGVAIASRTGRLAEFLKLGARSTRVLTKSRFFTKIKIKKHNKNKKR